LPAGRCSGDAGAGARARGLGARDPDRGPGHGRVRLGNEPALTGLENFVEVTVSDASGEPVVELGPDASVEVSFGEASTVEPLIAAEEPGAFRATLVPTRPYITATDSKGLTGQAPFQLIVNPKAPNLENLKVRPKKSKPITFDLSKASTVSFLVHKVKKKPKVKDKTFPRSLTSGSQKVPLTGRFKGKKLKPGKYQLTAIATDSVGLQSSTATTKFKIKKKKKRK
jgi:hypothetical protein